MQISSIKIYSNKTSTLPCAPSLKPTFAGKEKNDAQKQGGFFSNISRLKENAGDKFLKTSSTPSAKDNIYKRFNDEFDTICSEHQTTRDERDTLLTKFDFTTLNKETELKLDEDKNLKNVFIKNTNDDTKSVKLDFDKEKLSGATYIIDGKKIKMKIKSPDFEKSFLRSEDFDMSTGVLIGDINKPKLEGGFVAEHFDSINNVVYGKMPMRLQHALNEYEKKYEGKKIYVDHNVDPVVIKNCIEIFDRVPLDEIPQAIIITNFMEENTAGTYCQTDEVLVKPTKDKARLRGRLFHEMQHRKDYLSGKSLGQEKTGYALMFDNKILHDCDGQILDGKIRKSGYNLVFTDNELKELIKDKVSEYAATNATEFIAEVGSMMRQGIIGVCEGIKTNNTLYSINGEYKNVGSKNCKINEEEFKTLIKTYELLGGIPEYNDKIFCKDAIILTQEDIFAPE